MAKTGGLPAKHLWEQPCIKRASVDRLNALGDLATAHRKWYDALLGALVCRTSTPLGGNRYQDLSTFTIPPLDDRDASFMRWHIAHMFKQARWLVERVREDKEISRDHYAIFAMIVDAFENRLAILRRRLDEELRAMDPVTGLPGRAFMVADIRRRQQRMRYTGRRGSICMVDLDHFKAINDVHGHSIGDEVLREVAERLSRTLLPADRVYRFGGEEFLVFMPFAAGTHAEVKAERLRQCLGDAPFKLSRGIRLTVTACFGVSPLEADRPLEEAVDTADLAMYLAKRAGRNAVRALRVCPRTTVSQQLREEEDDGGLSAPEPGQLPVSAFARARAAAALSPSPRTS